MERIWYENFVCCSPKGNYWVRNTWYQALLYGDEYLQKDKCLLNLCASVGKKKLKKRVEKIWEDLKKKKKFLKKKKMKKEHTDFFLNEQNWKIIGKKKILKKTILKKILKKKKRKKN